MTMTNRSKKISRVSATNDRLSQSEMLDKARQRLVDRDRVFMEIMSGPNPLTADEIETLAAKHPERWARYRKFAKGIRESGSEPVRGTYRRVSVNAAVINAVRYLAGQYLASDLKLDKSHGGGYVPTAEVLAQRERHRQKEEIDDIGRSLFGSQYASEHLGDKGVWVTYRDNRDKRAWQDHMNTLAARLSDYGLQLKGNTVAFDRKRVQAAMEAHKSYLQLLANRGSSGAKKMLGGQDIAASGRHSRTSSASVTKAQSLSNRPNLRAIRRLIAREIVDAETLARAVEEALILKRVNPRLAVQISTHVADVLGVGDVIDMAA